MRVVAIIQARLGSTRLPRKVLMEIAGRPMIDHVIERALAIKGVDRVVLNVPEHDASAFIVVRERYQHAESYGIIGVPGQEQDVLGSYLTCAVAEKADVIMRLTGDCPLLAPDVCRDVLNLATQCGKTLAHYSNDTWRSGFPDGTDCEVFSLFALGEAGRKAVLPEEREHVTLWMRRHMPNYAVLAPYEWHKELKDVKLSIDNQEDLHWVRTLYRYLKPGQLSINETALAYRDMIQDLGASRAS